MSPAVMAYATQAAIVLGAAALLGEQAARSRGLPSRPVWAAAMLAAVLLPLLAPLLPASAPSIQPFIQSALDTATRATLDGRGDQWLRAGGIALSAAVALWLGLSASQLSVRARSWQATIMEGVPVVVAPNLGPAVFGLLRPRIVVPSWLVRLPRGQRALVVAHERAHLDGRDPWWLAIALVVITVMPWNLPVWWLLHRLRRAIEIDCDARVLRSGCDFAAYGETLIAVGQQRSSGSWTMAGMVPSNSFLERRITIMSIQLSKHSALVAVAFAALSIAMVGLAAELRPPSMEGPRDIAGQSGEAAAASPSSVVTLATDHTRRLDAEAAQLHANAAKLEAEAMALGERAAKQAAAMKAFDADAAQRSAEMKALDESAKKLETEALALGAIAAKRALEAAKPVSPHTPL
jgi:hypothetical protein